MIEKRGDRILNRTAKKNRECLFLICAAYNYTGILE
jgi:hypothetical protein